MLHRSFSVKSIALLAAMLLPAAILTGCGIGVQAPEGNALIPNGTVSGHVFGGNQPVSGAIITLYAVGSSGYGSAGTLLATATSKSDGFGSFSFSQVASGATGPTGNSYVCPSGNPLLYIIANGGNTVGSGTNNNTAAVFMTAVGPCSTAAGSFIDVNEVTTVATVFALAQYINPGTTAGSESIGAPSVAQAQLGLTNAFNTVANLVTVATGAANTSTTISGTGTNLTTSATVTIIPETAKINTIGNILSSCANSATGATSTTVGTTTTPTNCGTLFTYAIPPAPALTSQPTATFSTAVDTTQAAYYMATNPVDGSNSNLTNLFNLQGSTVAFLPDLSTAPTDWTIGVTYDGGASACNSTGKFINYAYDMSIDASGNVWMSNGAATTDATSEISPIGKPLACSGAVGSSRGGAAIDTAGNVWSADGFTATSTAATYVYKFDGTTTTAIPISATTGAKSYAVAADGNGNVFITDSGKLMLYELPASATASTIPTLIGTINGSSPYSLAIDTKGTVVVGQSGSSGSTITAYTTTTVGGSTYVASPGLSLAQTGAYAGVYGVAFDKNGAFWIGNSAGTSLSAGTAPGNTTSSTPVTYSSTTLGATNGVTFSAPSNVTPVFAGGITTGRKVAIDGADNVWIANNSAASSGLYAVTELTNAGVAISPSSSAAGSGTTETENGGFQKAATVFAGLRAISIDPSGNVWVSNTASTANTFITEIVGAAVPVVTPLSIATKTGKLGVAPQ